MAERALVLGGGGHGRVVLDALLAAGVDVAGILDPAAAVGERVFGVPVLGDDTYLESLGDARWEFRLVNGVGADSLALEGGPLARRRELFERLKARSHAFLPLQHAAAVIGRDCVVGEGAQVMAGAVLQCGVHVGANAVINTSASIDHDCAIGAHAFISPGAVLCGAVTVAESVFVGAGAIVLPNVRLGAYAVIGAGAVVTSTVQEGACVAGIPATALDARRTRDERCRQV